MRMLLSFLLCTLFQLVSCALYSTHEKREVPLQDALDRQKLDGNVILPVRISLRQNEDAVLNSEAWLMAVSDPESSQYGQHWSQEEVHRAFQPSEEALEAVTAWLSEHGINHYTLSENRQWLVFEIRISEAETLLQTQYFEHRDSNNRFKVSCDEYSLPSRLREHIDFVSPGVVVRDITGLTQRSREYLHSGIFEDGSLTLQSDLNKFFEYYTDIPLYTAPIYDSIDGAIVQPNQTRSWRKKYLGTPPIPWSYVLGESTLDLELAYPIVWPQTVTVFQSDDWYYEGHLSIHYGLFNDFFDGIDGSYCTYTAFNESKGNSTLYRGYALYPTYPDPRPHGYKGKLQCGAFKPTNVISISYAVPELLVSWLWQKRQCLEFLKLGLQGVSTFVASGDQGVGFCSRGPVGDRLFNPSTPAACPWITSVGGTRIQKNHSVHDPEIAVHGGYGHFGWSGGGFSIVYDRPSYQQAAVSSFFDRADLDIPYFKNGQFKNNSGRYNRDGRGFPDIAAVAFDIATVLLSNYAPGSGTSASTPIVASLFNRINEERIRIGKGPLGFINPALYKNADALNDILQGNNLGPCTQGFKCIKGWDPVTGLGTPNYPKLLEVFLGLP